VIFAGPGKWRGLVLIAVHDQKRAGDLLRHAAQTEGVRALAGVGKLTCAPIYLQFAESPWG
jgi:hypothetical protein